MSLPDNDERYLTLQHQDTIFHSYVQLKYTIVKLLSIEKKYFVLVHEADDAVPGMIPVLAVPPFVSDGYPPMSNLLSIYTSSSFVNCELLAGTYLEN
jgi:hypothetical protein